MLRLTECEHCGESLHSFIDELEDRTQLHVVVCPTCYQTILYPGVPSEQVAVSQRVPLLERTIYTS